MNPSLRAITERRRSYSAWLAWTLLAALAVLPFLWPGTKQLDVSVKIMIFIMLVASYDLLLGYSGVVSFAHTMFFGIGAYAIAIASNALGAGWLSLGVGVLAAVLAALLLALLVGAFSLRFSAIYFAMISLALASAFATFMLQASELTGGDDGLNFKLPAALTPAFSLREDPFLGAVLNGRLLLYFGILATVCCAVLFLVRLVDSPFGKVLEVIRENSLRVDALGLETFRYRLVANLISAAIAALAGCLFAVWVRYTGPDTALNIEWMLDVLLVLVIGGMGTIYGSVMGAVIFVCLQNYLKDMIKWLADGAGQAIGFDGAILGDRWMLWLGLLFIACVYYFPEGMAGRLARIQAKSSRSVRSNATKAAAAHVAAASAKSHI